MTVEGAPDGVWADVGWGGEVDLQLWEGLAKTRVATISKVTDDEGQEKYELWRIRTSNPGGRNPCDVIANGDDSSYVDNTNKFDGDVTGRYADLIPWDPNPEVANVFTDEQGKPAAIYVFDSVSGRDWHMPGDYNASYTWLLGWLEIEEDGAKHSFFYMGTRDTLMCNYHSDNDHSTGKAVAVSEVIRLPEPVLGAVIFTDNFDAGNLDRWSAREP